MAYLHWVPELDTGIAEIDTQHKRILDYINKLHDLRSSPDRAALGDVIGETVDYTLSHFAFEESVIESAGYMFAGPHKKVHELVPRKEAERQSRFDADSVKAYLRMPGKQRDADRAELKAERRRELAAKQNGRRGGFARLFGG